LIYSGFRGYENAGNSGDYSPQISIQLRDKTSITRSSIQVEANQNSKQV